MRIMMNGPGRGALPRGMLCFFYFYFFLHWGTGLFMFRHKLGFTYESVVRYYRGDPELFMNPRSFAGLLEVTHFHLFAMGLFFVVFSHLLLFTSLRPRLQGALVGLLAAGMSGDMAAGWLVCFLAPEFAWVKLGSFWLLQGTSLFLLLSLLTSLVKRPFVLP